MPSTINYIIIEYQRLFNVRSPISHPQADYTRRSRLHDRRRAQELPGATNGSRPFGTDVADPPQQQSQSAGFMPAACPATFFYLTCFAPRHLSPRGCIDLRERATRDCSRDMRTCDTAISVDMIHKRADEPHQNRNLDAIPYKRIGSRARKKTGRNRCYPTTTGPIRSDEAAKSENPTTRHTYRDVLKRG